MAYEQPGYLIPSVYVLKSVQYEYKIGIRHNSYLGVMVSSRVTFTAPARRPFRWIEPMGMNSVSVFRHISTAWGWFRSVELVHEMANLWPMATSRLATEIPNDARTTL